MEALAFLKNKKIHIDLLITDMVMPEMNGNELAEKIKNFVPDIRILFTSGYTEERIQVDGIIDDRVQFIQKPYSTHSLGKIVREILDSR
jgi:two-component SAPR family response regulator